MIFYVHRTFSAVILVTNLWLAWQIVRNVDRTNILHPVAITLASLIVIAIATGVTMDRFGIPAVVQPVHLLLASLIFGVQFFIFMTYRYSRGRAHVAER